MGEDGAWCVQLWPISPKCAQKVLPQVGHWLVVCWDWRQGVGCRFAEFVYFVSLQTCPVCRRWHFCCCVVSSNKVALCLCFPGVICSSSFINSVLSISLLVHDPSPVYHPSTTCSLSIGHLPGIHHLYALYPEPYIHVVFICLNNEDTLVILELRFEFSIVGRLLTHQAKVLWQRGQGMGLIVGDLIGAGFPGRPALLSCSNPVCFTSFHAPVDSWSPPASLLSYRLPYIMTNVEGFLEKLLTH